VQRLKLAAREACERTIESLGLSALAASSVYQRDGLLGAQFELNRKSAVFVLAFNDAFDQKLLRELGGQRAAADAAPPPTSWDALSLVDDHEVETQISAERFGQEVAHACEWELRDLDGLVASLLAEAAAAAGGPGAATSGVVVERNPLRPDLVGHALMKGVDAVSERDDLRKVLATELGRSLGTLLRAAYAASVSDLRDAGVRPLSLGVRTHAGRGTDSARGGVDPTTRDGGLGSAMDSLHSQSDAHPQGLPALSSWARGLPGGPRAGSAGRGMGMGMGAGNGHNSGQPGGGGGRGGGGGTPLGAVDPALMGLLRRLAVSQGGDGGSEHGAVHGGGGGGIGGGGIGSGGAGGWDTGAAPPPNVIHAHRDALRQASRGQLDHMVIDVIGGLFDQILSDPKVPPQVARQIARLQLPVLRAALGDPSFFSSRRHPVRRFVNRIASLGAAFEDFDEDGARALLAKMRELVHQIVEGDFDQIETYEQQLAALEAFVAEQSAQAAKADGDPAAVLADKEVELLLQQAYAQRLDGDLKPLAAPDFVRDFIARTWSQVLLRAGARTDGGVTAARMRRAGRDLFMSVQPKATPAQRKVFLADLPKLMQDLNEGMNLIAWSDAHRREFFGRLMPAHAEALKTPGLQPLDINLMALQVDRALEKPLPSRRELQELRATLPVLTDALEMPELSADEARRVGLLSESAIDWDGTVDIDLTAEEAAVAAAAGSTAGAAVAPEAPPLPGVPALADTAEPVSGAALAASVQLGSAYRMHLEGAWHKVRLTHVSEGRNFFVFTRGGRHKQALSLTRRMLLRLCDSGRLRAFEEAWLMERATARARRQLAAVGTAAAN